jgi:actin-related protein 2
MFPGMPNRLQKDIEDRYINEILQGDESRLKKCKINIEAPR